MLSCFYSGFRAFSVFLLPATCRSHDRPAPQGRIFFFFYLFSGFFFLREKKKRVKKKGKKNRKTSKSEAGRHKKKLEGPYGRITSGLKKIIKTLEKEKPNGSLNIK